MTEQRFAYLLILPLLLFLLCVVLYPLGYSVWISTQNIDVISNTREFVGWDEYARALSDPEVWHATIVTLAYTAEVTVFSFFVSLGMALLLNQRFRFRGILAAIVIIPWSVSTYAAAVAFRYVYSADTGLLNALIYRVGLIHHYVVFITSESAITTAAIAHTWQIAPLGALVMLASLQVIPPDIYKSARVDGLGPIRRFFYVTFPYLRHSILVILCVITVEAARVFDLIYFLTGGGPANSSETLTYLIYRETFMQYDLGYGAAISWLLTIVITLITIIYFILLFRKRKAQA
jgi:ABC-type sugar transport system permease subunit